MIRFQTGDILALDVAALVNPVNCVGAMGRGLALQFKTAFPENFRAYADACARGDVRPGRMFIFERTTIANPRYIVNFPTKRHWRGKSRMEDIEAGLDALAESIREHDIRSIAVPPLGTGLGGLDWETVRQRVEGVLGHLEGVAVVVFEPLAAPVLAAGEAETERQRRTRKLNEVIEDIRATAPGFSARENLSREELYDRARARVGMAGCSPAGSSDDT